MGARVGRSVRRRSNGSRHEPDCVISVGCRAHLSLAGFYLPYVYLLEMAGGQAVNFKAGPAYSDAR